jgi:hypothetical protein
MTRYSFTNFKAGRLPVKFGTEGIGITQTTFGKEVKYEKLSCQDATNIF